MSKNISNEKTPCPSAQIIHEEGFVDLGLPFDKIQIIEGNRHKISTRCRIDDEEIAISIIFSGRWTHKKTSPEVDLYWGSAEIYSDGDESSNFLNKLAQLYGVKPSSRLMIKNYQLVTVVGLNSHPLKLTSESVKTKFFFNENGPEDLYSELFVNIDPSSRIVWLNEKCDEYRLPLIKSLASLP